MKERFIELLEEDASRWRKAADNWKMIGGTLVDLQGRTIAAAADMVAEYEAREKEARDMIASIKALP